MIMFCQNSSLWTHSWVALQGMAHSFTELCKPLCQDACSLEGKLWQSGQYIKKQNIALPTKVWMFKTMVFPVVMYRCESWAIKRDEHWRINAFEEWWERLLRVPWTARRSNQSVLKEVNSEYSLEKKMLKLKFQYFGHLMQRASSLEKTLMLGKINGRRRSGRGWNG